MHILASAIAITWRRNALYGERLIADLTDAQMVSQPVPDRAMNHPAWVMSHLNLYASLALALLQRTPIADPADHIFGQKSVPLPGTSAYPSHEALRTEWRRLHEACAALLPSVDDTFLCSPTPLERWRTVHPCTGEMLTTLMVKHESAHLGQLSAWRRAMGLPRVPQ